MTTAEQYIESVLEVMPPATPQRAQIALELEAHIAERVGHGHPLEDVLRQLGDPVALADSYLAANPLIPSPHGDRVLAKLIDALAVGAALGALLVVASRMAPEPPAPLFLLLAVVFCGAALLGVYTILAEYRSGQTLGKRLRGLSVVHESGRRVGLGRAVVRQLPLALSVYWIDAVFALFTDRRQRAFELLSKTRVVLTHPPEVP